MRTEKKGNLKQRSFVFSLNVIRFVQSIKHDQVSRVICNQLIRSASSIGANIVEARAASSKKEFINFFTIALKSANETKYWLMLLEESDRGKYHVSGLLSEAEEISNMIGSSVLTLKGK